jgi:hypothetical protein
VGATSERDTDLKCFEFRAVCIPWFDNQSEPPILSYPRLEFAFAWGTTVWEGGHAPATVQVADIVGEYLTGHCFGGKVNQVPLFLGHHFTSGVLAVQGDNLTESQSRII